MPLDADPDGRSSATAATTANPARALTHLCKGVGEVVILAQPLRTPSPAPAEGEWAILGLHNAGEERRGKRRMQW